MKRVLIEVVLIAAAFGAGYGWIYFQKRSAEEAAEKARQELETRLAQAEDRLRAATLQGLLGHVLIEVEKDNFGRARELSTGFFDGVRSALNDTKDDTIRKRLEGVLEQRDQITADMAELKPGTAEALRRLYLQFMGSSN